MRAPVLSAGRRKTSVRALMNSATPARSAVRRASAMRAANSAGERKPSSMLIPTAPASSTSSTVRATPPEGSAYPPSMSAETGTETASTILRSAATAAERVRASPSGRPSDHATPALVVATAGAPAASMSRALAASQALTRMRGLDAPRLSVRKRATAVSLFMRPANALPTAASGGFRPSPSRGRSSAGSVEGEHLVAPGCA